MLPLITFLDLMCFSELSSCCSSCWSSLRFRDSRSSPIRCLQDTQIIWHAPHVHWGDSSFKTIRNLNSHQIVITCDIFVWSQFWPSVSCIRGTNFPVCESEFCQKFLRNRQIMDGPATRNKCMHASFFFLFCVELEMNFATAALQRIKALLHTLILIFMHYIHTNTTCTLISRKQ